ncbi:MAG: hypothetical protein U0163_15725 [Gemmatimonadaceae bacterium]
MPPTEHRSPRWRLVALAVILLVIIVGVGVALRHSGRATPLLDVAP